MRADKKSAIKLRKSGKSYAEINKLLSIPKSTLSDWLKTSDWSNKIKKELAKKAQEKSTINLRQLNRIYRNNLEKIYKEARIEASKEFEYFKFHPLFIAGISIYWGEGDKTTKHLVRITNTDTAMIKLFIKFLVEVCGVQNKKIKAYILIYPDLNSNNCIGYWAKQSNLSIDNFNKCVTITGKHKSRRLPYGVCNITVSSSYLKEKINLWLKLLPKEFINNKYYKKEYYAGVV